MFIREQPRARCKYLQDLASKKDIQVFIFKKKQGCRIMVYMWNICNKQTSLETSTMQRIPLADRKINVVVFQETDEMQKIDFKNKT